jgi:hypothetical protein
LRGSFGADVGGLFSLWRLLRFKAHLLLLPQGFELVTYSQFTFEISRMYAGIITLSLPGLVEEAVRRADDSSCRVRER